MINIEKKECCGCSACAAVCPQMCIEMQEDNEGFFYPIVDKSICIQCGLCKRVCPVINVKQEVPFQQDGYVVQNKNNAILKESTSGGAFTAISEQVITKGGIVFGVSLDNDLLPYYTWVDSLNDLHKLRNSKYVQSKMDGEILRQVKFFLGQGKFVCFSGTPCQIEGLKSYLRKDYDKLVLIDVVCRAIPSRLIYRKYLDLQRNRLNGEIKSICFRDKYYGYKYSTLNITTDKNTNYHKGIESDPWLRAFFSNICNRVSCYDCKFKKRYRESDITLWDCFIVSRYSKKMDNDKGATKVLIHTEKGRKIFEEAMPELNYVMVNADSLARSSVEMTVSVKPHIKRSEFFSDAQVFNGIELFNKWFPETIKVRLKHFFRLAFFKLGIYKLVKKTWYCIKHKT